MEGNDISPFLSGNYAIMFEALAFTPEEVKPVPATKRGLFRRTKNEVEEEQLSIESTVRKWKPREMALKSLIHLVDQLGKQVDVYTYFPPEYVVHIEHWLARKGAHVSVYSYDDLEQLRDDFKYNRDVQILFTPFQDDAAMLGPRATVVALDKTWGI